MKRSNEFAVGLTALVALAVIVIGAVLLGQLRIGRGADVRTARFRSVGGLGPGASVTLRGVKIGRVATIRVAADDWVEVDFRLKPDQRLPARPAAIAAPATLFGEWRVNILSLDETGSDQSVRPQLAEAAGVGGDIWPGALVALTWRATSSWDFAAAAEGASTATARSELTALLRASYAWDSHR